MFLTVIVLWVFFNPRTCTPVNRAYNSLLYTSRPWTAGGLRTNSSRVYNFTRSIHNRAATCLAAEGGIFENLL